MAACQRGESIIERMVIDMNESQVRTVEQVYLYPFLNFHRPCLFATDKLDPKKPGRIKRVYRAKDAMTPLDKLASLPEAATFLREGVTLEHLHALATALTDVQAGEELNEARLALLRRVPPRAGRRVLRAVVVDGVILRSR